MIPAIIIPARLQSKRLPGKPLVDILGKSMIQRTYERCVQALPPENVHVATDDETIRLHCQKFNASVIMTSRSCLTGTDRIAEAIEQLDCDVVINVQGDEPIINYQDIQQVMIAAEKYPGEVINGMAPIETEDEFRNPSIPKVVTRPDGRLLYMSRGAIPTSKSLEFSVAHRQICIYAFPKEALVKFASSKVKTPLENVEDIEILRFLEMGYEVRMISLSGTSYAVDTPEDLKKIREIIQENPDV